MHPSKLSKIRCPAIARRTAVALLALATIALSLPATAQAILKTRDINTVSPACDPVTFIVSMNNDDDDNNGTRDYRDAALPAGEDNLRQFTFNLAGASKVFIGEPVMVQGGTTAVGRGKRVRAYTAARQPFVFNRVYNTPVTMFLEGVKTSTNRLDFGFEYDYRDDADKHICGPGAQGTVVRGNARFSAKAGSGTAFNTNKKMLITGVGNAKSKWVPAGYTPAWSYNGTAVLATPNANDTRFTAGTTITPAGGLNSEVLLARVQEAGLIIEAHVPVNITAPVHAQEYQGWINGAPIDSPSATRWHDANRGRFSLFSTSADYHLQDQFRQRIKTSAWAGRQVQVRENIGRVLVSTIPAVQNWINRSLRWTRRWKSKSNGEINDRLRVQLAPKSLIIQRRAAGGQEFIAPMRAVGGVMMNLGANTHQWEASVNGQLPTVVTQNTFSVVTTNVCNSQVNLCGARPNHPRPRGIVIRLRSSYGVVTP